MLVKTNSMDTNRCDVSADNNCEPALKPNRYDFSPAGQLFGDGHGYGRHGHLAVASA